MSFAAHTVSSTKPRVHSSENGIFFRTVGLLRIVVLNWRVSIACIAVPILLAGPVVGRADEAASKLQPVRLRCEYAASPVGLHTAKPRFTWGVE